MRRTLLALYTVLVGVTIVTAGCTKKDTGPKPSTNSDTTATDGKP